MPVNRVTFYRRFRPVFGRLTQSQVDGYEAIFDFWDSRSVLQDKRWLAYILATAFHETGQRLQPVRECFCSTDACSIRCVTTLYNQGRIPVNYAIPHPNGNSYFGRGLVQITHGTNYKRAGREIGLGNQLYDNPDLALRLDISVKILCIGMLVGLFVPDHNLQRYFNNSVSDWKNARRIVNGLDKWREIKGYALNMLGFIELDVQGHRIDATDVDLILELYERGRVVSPDKQKQLEMSFDQLRGQVDRQELGTNIYDIGDRGAPARNEADFREVITDQPIGQHELGEEPTLPPISDQEDEESCCVCCRPI